MAEAQYPTLVDVASRMDANGDIAPIAEVLSKNNAILRHIGWQECNMTEGHKHSLRTGIPEPTWRGLYEGVQPTKSTTASVVDVTSNVEMYTDVDCDLADINGNTYQFRMSEQTASFQGMANSVATALYYGDNDKDIRKFTGLATRYNTLSKKVPCAKNCISAIDSSYVETPDGYTSIFIVNKDQFIGLYPKGSKYGLSHTDKGQVTVTAPDGKGSIPRPLQVAAGCGSHGLARLRACLQHSCEGRSDRSDERLFGQDAHSGQEPHSV